MVLHVVRTGDTAAGLAQAYGVPLSQILLDNALSPADALVPGQALVIQFPLETYTVRAGDTAAQIAGRAGLTLRQLYRNNPILGGRPDLYAGQTLVLSYRQEKEGALSVNGYAYPFINQDLL